MAIDLSLPQSQIFSALGARLAALESGGLPPILDGAILKALLLTGQNFSAKGIRVAPTQKVNAATDMRPSGAFFQGSFLRFNAGSYALEGWDFSDYTVYLDTGRSATFADCKFGATDKRALQLLNDASVDCAYCTFDGRVPTANYPNLVTMQNQECVGSFRDCIFTGSYSDAIDYQGDLIVERNWFHTLGQGQDPDNHFDMMQNFTGSSSEIKRLVARNNFFDGRVDGFGKTNIIRLATQGASISNVLIEGNIMLWPQTDSAPMHLSAGSPPSGAISNVIVRNNYIDKESPFYLYPDVPPPAAPAIWANNKGFGDLLEIAIPSGSGFTSS